MASASTLAKYNNDMKRFEYQINNILEGIDRHKKSKEADDDTMSKHYHSATENGERVWRF